MLTTDSEHIREVHVLISEVCLYSKSYTTAVLKRFLIFRKLYTAWYHKLIIVNEAITCETTRFLSLSFFSDHLFTE